jgi:hypothetical protein
MARSTIEIVQVGPQHAAALGRFFENLEARGIGKVFHPPHVNAPPIGDRTSIASLPKATT